MKSILTLALISTLFVSCGKDPFSDLIHRKETDPRMFDKTNPVFDSYAVEFQKKHEDVMRKEIRISHIPINFADTEKDGDENTIGICYSWSSGKREIIINQHWWATASECDRQVLINHELGHCALNRGHKDSRDGNLKLSQMNSWHLSGRTYCDLESGYDFELFTHDHSELGVSDEEKENQ